MIRCVRAIQHRAILGLRQVQTTAILPQADLNRMESLPRVRVAVAQMTSGGDQAQNLMTCRNLAQEAALAQCKMLFLPECFSFIGNSQQAAVDAAQDLSGELMQRYCALARETKLWLSLGGFQERGPDPQHIYNCHAIVSAEGEIVAAYRKIHLFDVNVPSGPILMESGFTAPGTHLVTCDTPVGRLGLSTCYDLRFPHLYQRLAQAGAHIMLVPSAFTKPTGEAHWLVLLRARAIETQTFVIAAAQAGRHNEKRESYGHSVVIDPWGTVVAQLEDPLRCGIAVADLDLSMIDDLRARMPIQQHTAAGLSAVNAPVLQF